MKVDSVQSHEKVIKQFALGAAGVISPMCAFMGGVAGQEVRCRMQPTPPHYLNMLGSQSLFRQVHTDSSVVLF